jgi:hypothetical protein
MGTSVPNKPDGQSGNNFIELANSIKSSFWPRSQLDQNQPDGESGDNCIRWSI